MEHQAMVIGLGQFGMAVARALADSGAEVLAVDLRENRVRTASAFVAEAVTMDATAEDQLAHLAPELRDLCVCAIGDEAREGSIIVTALLRQMGAKRVVARATDDLHERILRLVGAHEVVNPERIFGERLATRMLHRGVVDLMPLGPDLEITELLAPAGMVGRALTDLSLPRQFQVTVVAIRRGGEGPDRVVMPEADSRVLEGDVLVLVGPRNASNQIVERLS
jgi:trk system potassium uptake protein